ncbi:helix-turn-helix domain-containing protein [Maricaulis sp.]|uniref:winged helix-turn-helix transcriptional regulator n=1 Tax=Maricaulis sp. TaxID=1486257 RepID=UPI0025B7C983|nr:helix-turn-helix domain-containing protein [Maricaulis sp.]
MTHMMTRPPADLKLVRCCSIWRALEDIGDVPTMLILEAVWLGERRFDGFQKRTGLLKALLSQRLKQMVAAGLLEKRLYCERPPRYEYIMTEKGRDLYWVALAMLRWEQKWGAAKAKFKVRLTHRACGGDHIDPVPFSLSAGREFNARDVSWKHGPGMGWVTPRHSRRRKPRGEEQGADNNLLDVILRVLGDRWASLILRSIFTGFRRYDEIQKDAAIATNILADRLQWLIDMGLIHKRAYSDAPPRYEYRLTEAGIDYYPVLVMLMVWGDRWYLTPEGPPLLLFHRDSGEPLKPVMACSNCHKPLDPTEVDFTIEPVDGGDQQVFSTR